MSTEEPLRYFFEVTFRRLSESCLEEADARVAGEHFDVHVLVRDAPDAVSALERVLESLALRYPGCVVAGGMTATLRATRETVVI
jgi:hypothetical protein